MVLVFMILLFCGWNKVSIFVISCTMMLWDVRSESIQWDMRSGRAVILFVFICRIIWIAKFNWKLLSLTSGCNNYITIQRSLIKSNWWKLADFQSPIASKIHKGIYYCFWLSGFRTLVFTVFSLIFSIFYILGVYRLAIILWVEELILKMFGCQHPESQKLPLCLY